jgi:hypothetical protein
MGRPRSGPPPVRACRMWSFHRASPSRLGDWGVVTPRCSRVASGRSLPPVAPRLAKWSRNGRCPQVRGNRPRPVRSRRTAWLSLSWSGGIRTDRRSGGVRWTCWQASTGTPRSYAPAWPRDCVTVNRWPTPSDDWHRGTRWSVQPRPQPGAQRPATARRWHAHRRRTAPPWGRPRTDPRARHHRSPRVGAAYKRWRPRSRPGDQSDRPGVAGVGPLMGPDRRHGLPGRTGPRDASG